MAVANEQDLEGNAPGRRIVQLPLSPPAQSLRAIGRRQHRLHGRQHQGHEHANDRNHDQELDQRDGAALRAMCEVGFDVKSLVIAR
jgi:hypothetical protein